MKNTLVTTGDAFLIGGSVTVKMIVETTQMKKAISVVSRLNPTFVGF